MRVLTIAGVNLRRFLRERTNIFFVLIFPLALVLVLGSLFGGGFEARIGVVAPQEPLAQDLVDRMASAGGLDVVPYEDRSALLDAVERGEASAGVVIPDGYDGLVSSGEQVEIGFIARPDGVGPALRFGVLSAIGEQTPAIRSALFASARTGVAFEQALEAARGLDASLPRPSVETTFVGESEFGQDLGRFDLGAPSMLVLFMFLTGLTASAALIQSRQLGVSTRMLSTPTGTTTIVIGEGLGRISVVLFQGVYIMLATALLFGVDWGSPPGAVALLLVFGLVSAGAGMLMGSIFSNDQQAGGVAVLAGLGLAALGGCMVPLEIFSPTMRSIAHVTPHAWAIDGFAELVRRNGDIAGIAGILGILAGYAAVLLLLAGWRLRAAITR